MPRRLRALLVATLGATVLLPVPPPAEAAAPRQIAYRHWATAAQLGRGTLQGVKVSAGALVLDKPVGRTTLGPTQYDVGRWVSPLVSPGFDLTELVPSWTAGTPGNSLVRIEVGGVTAKGGSTGWDTISNWAAADRYVKRTSLGPQPDGGASVAYDTWRAPSGVRRWRLRVTLLRKVGTTVTPSVDTVGAMVSRLPAGTSPTSRPTGLAKKVRLAVPRYSQMVHQGEYPQYDGGGEAWCSPTSTTMVLAYYKKLPPASSYAWVDTRYPDRFVAHAARMTFDYSFDGTGNWPFNTAYAASRTGFAFVTRMRSLRDAERFIAAGIPVVASISFGKGQLSGAPISATNGHLVVIVGFTGTGQVVVNDPAAASNAKVQRVYDRGQFESAWTRRSGGLAYVIRDAAHPLPPRDGARNW